VKKPFLNYLLFSCLAVSSAQCYAVNDFLEWANQTEVTLYYMVMHEDSSGNFTCTNKGTSLALLPDGMESETVDASSAYVYSIVSTESFSLACDSSVLNQPSNVLVTKYTYSEGSNKSQILQESASFDTQVYVLSNNDSRTYEYSMSNYTPTPPPPTPANITTVSFSWNNSQGNSPQGLSSTAELLAQMLNKKYPQYEYMNTEITKNSDNKYDLTIKYHDTSKDA